MSIDIETDTITDVLLIDGWHEVEPGSVYFDAFEIIVADGALGRFIAQPKAESMGLCWRNGIGRRMAAPLDKIHAVRFDR